MVSINWFFTALHLRWLMSFYLKFHTQYSKADFVEGDACIYSSSTNWPSCCSRSRTWRTTWGRRDGWRWRSRRQPIQSIAMSSCRSNELRMPSGIGNMKHFIFVTDAAGNEAAMAVPIQGISWQILFMLITFLKRYKVPIFKWDKYCNLVIFTNDT